MLSKWVLRMLSLHLFLFKIVFNLFKSYSVKINFSDASCPAQHFADCADCQANVCWHVMDYYFDFYDFTQPFRYTWYCWVEGFNRDKVRWGVSVFWDYDVMIFYCNCRTEWVHSTTLLRPLFTNFLFSSLVGSKVRVLVQDLYGHDSVCVMSNPLALHNYDIYCRSYKKNNRLQLW